MQKRRTYLVLLILAVLGMVALIVAVAFREREPEYGGKKLSEWVELYATPPRINLLRQSEEAADAIRHIGTNGLPFLLEWMRYEPSPWQSTLYAELNERLHLSLGVAVEKKRHRAVAATRAFHALGPEADGAIPELTRLLNDTNVARPTRWRVTLDQHVTPWRAALALAGLGEPGLPPLETLLTNQQAEAMLRCVAARDIIMYGTNGRSAAFGALRDMLRNPDANVRNQASNAIWSIDPLTLTPKNSF